MANITIEELYRGEKYDIMSAVTAKALQLGIPGQDHDVPQVQGSAEGY